MFRTILFATTFLAAGTVAALAHITLDVKEAKPGATVRITLRVPHGCEGKATDTVRLRLPEGVFSAKPMPKPGWAVETVKGPYEKAYDDHGNPVTEGVKEIVWSGGSLPDEFYDEFVFRGTFADGLKDGETLYFPIVQQCGDAAARWIEIPAAGQDSHDLEHPAPGIKLVK
jgi:uncharacterized protein YcnI